MEYKGIINLVETSNDLRLSSIPKEQILNYIPMSFNQSGYEKHCKDYKDYTTWIENRNVQRYVDIEGHGQRIDGKNLLHCYRLLETGIEIARDKTINVRRPNAQFLIEIRKGKHNLQELLDKSSALMEQLDNEFDNCDLPHSADRSFFMKLMVQIRKNYKYE